MANDDTPPASPAEPDEGVDHNVGRALDDLDAAFPPAATNEEVARVVKRLTSGNAGWADLCQAADLLARVAKENGKLKRLTDMALAATVEAALATPPASPAATDKEVARMVERLRKPVYTFHINEEGGPNITVEGENRFAMEREVSLLADAGREAADLLARVAKERDEWRLQAKYETDVAAAEIDGRKTAEQRAETAEKEVARLRREAGYE